MLFTGAPLLSQLCGLGAHVRREVQGNSGLLACLPYLHGRIRREAAAIIRSRGA